MNTPLRSVTRFLSRTSFILSIAVGISGLVCYLSWSKKGILPRSSEILSELREDPVQTNISLPSFRFDYRGATYIVQPVAEYSLRGLVVTHNNTTGIGDMYHDKNSVDLKDACVIWGENTLHELYKKVSFWSEPWTCFYQAKDDDTFEEFRGDQLSNNHLLAATPEVADRIRSIHIGDQIAFDGYLVNYYPVGFPENIRKTSLVRTDTGNGACEVVFVKNIAILKRGNPIWNRLYDKSKTLLIILAIIKLISLVLFPYLDYKYG